jgi:hypothetical protein
VWVLASLKIQQLLFLRGVCGLSHQKVLENMIGYLTALRLACDVIEAVMMPDVGAA